MDTITIERKNTLAHATAIIDRAQAENRDITPSEQASVEADIARVKELDASRNGDSLAKRVMRLGSCDDHPGQDGLKYLTLRSPGIKSDLTAVFGQRIGTTGAKALTAPGDPYVSVPVDATIYREGEAPPALSEIIPAITRPVSFRYMRQTTRAHNAAPVAPGDLKPTSLYGLTPYEGRLHPVAHLSEPLDKYQLQDGPSLGQFVQEEMVAGLREAVETQIVSGDGLGENLTGLANTSGIQTQAYATSPVLTARGAVTKVETLGFQPYY
jgi:hypothetical protein